MKFIGSVATIIACTQLVSAPLAMAEEAKDAQVKRVREYLKISGLGAWKDLTVGEFYRKTRSQYPIHIQQKLDVWSANNRNEKMPSLRTSTFKDSEGREQVRLIFSKNGEEISFSTGGTPEKPSMAANAVVFDSKNAYADFAKVLIEQDTRTKESFARANYVKGPTTIPSYREFMLMSKKDRAYYFYQLRLTVDAAQKVFKATYGENANNQFDFPTFYQLLLEGESAFAKDSGPCLYAGWSTVRGEKGGCGGHDLGTANFAANVELAQTAFSSAKISCAPKEVPCNPYVYGFDGGKAFCVSASTQAVRNHATSNCNEASKLNGDGDHVNQQRIVKSWLAAQGEEAGDFTINDKGEIVGLGGKDPKKSQDLWLKIQASLQQLEVAVSAAEEACPPHKTVPNEQLEACNALRTRKFMLGLHLPSEEVEKSTKDCKTTAAVLVEATASETKCACREGTAPTPVGVKTTEKSDQGCSTPVIPALDSKKADAAPPAPVVDKAEPAKKDSKCEQKSWYSCNGWMWAVGAGVGGFLLGLATRKPGKTKVVTNTITNTVTVPGPIVYVPTPVAPPTPPSEGSRTGVPDYSTSPVRTTN